MTESYEPSTKKKDSDIMENDDDCDESLSCHDEETDMDNMVERRMMIGKESSSSSLLHENISILSCCSHLSTEHTSLLLLLVSAGSYSFMGCFVKLLTTTTNIPPIEIVFVRAVVQITIVVIAMFYFTIPVPTSSSPSQQSTTTTPIQTSDSNDIEEYAVTQQQALPTKEEAIIRHPLGLTRDVVILCIIRGICGGTGFCLYFYTISVLPLGDAITILSLNPVITVLFAPIILKESVTKPQLLSAFTSVIGSIILARPPFLFGHSPEDGEFDHDGVVENDITTVRARWGYLTGVLGACTGAGVYILLRKAGKKGVHTLNLLFSWCVFGLLISSVIMIKNGSFVWPSTTRTWIYLFFSCIFGMTAHFILNFAARLAPAGIASIIRSSGIIWSYLLEVLVFHQVPQASTMFGVGLVIISLGVIALEKQREAQQQEHMRIPTSEEEEEADLHSSTLQLQTFASEAVNSDNLHHRRNASTTSYGSLDDLDDTEK